MGLRAGHTDQPLVDILLSTYNGQKYLGAQIDSLFSQTYQDWNLIIRDDGSKDGTVEIIKSYRARYPDKLTFVEDASANLGASLNFGRLLEHAGADYMMFCDQDDVWLPDKVELTLHRMLDMEKAFGRDMPLLVHTDLTVVDENLAAVSDSFWKYQKLDPDKGKSFSRTLVYNVMTGCTAMINRRLRDLAVPIPGEAVMYDWWLVLVASAFGRIGVITRPTVLYRQHGKNVVGAKYWDLSMRLKKVLSVRRGEESRESARILLDKVLRFFDTREFRKSLSDSQRQARAFLERYKATLDERDFLKAQAYATMEAQNFFQKRLSLLKYRLFTEGVVRNIGLFLRV